MAKAKKIATEVVEVVIPVVATEDTLIMDYLVRLCQEGSKQDSRFTAAENGFYKFNGMFKLGEVLVEKNGIKYIEIKDANGVVYSL